MGMQWCTEFTQLIPNNQYRAHIVGYMRSLKRDSFDAMHKSLKAAEMGTGCEPSQQRVAEEEEDPPVLSEDPLPPPPNTLTPSALASSVAMAALVQAAINCAWDVRCLLRTLIVAHDIRGRCPPSNYTLSGGRMMRSSVRPPVAWFQERTLKELRREAHDIPLDKLRDTFGRTSHILRLVCTVRAQHAWPGDARAPHAGVR